MPDERATAIEAVRPVPYLLEPDEGETLSWFGATTTVKLSGRGFDVAVVTAVAGSGDRHLGRHRREDVALFVLEGDLVVDADEETFTAGTGCFLFLPRGVRHTVAVPSGQARVLAILGSPDALALHAEAEGARAPPAGRASTTGTT